MDKQQFYTFVENQFPGHGKNWGESWYYVEASQYLPWNYHFEYINNRVEFHVEELKKPAYNDIKDWITRFLPQLKFVKKESWRMIWTDGIKCDSDTDIFNEFCRVKSVYMSEIEKFAENRGFKPKHIDRPNPTNGLTVFLNEKKNNGNVSDVKLLADVKLKQLFDTPLFIPSYQRIYCWEKKNVDELFRDIRELNNSVYHLGTIILHRSSENVYDIVDGQQRLVTLTLLLNSLGYKGCLPLISSTFDSTEAIRYIAYNKYLCNRFAKRLKNAEDFCETLLQKLQFAVLVIDSANFDLAYTFFSNANSKGKPLSDFSLLKAHHLRYIESNPQQRHLATKWDKLTVTTVSEGQNILDCSLGSHILRLRKWMRAEPVNLSQKYLIRDEYVAAPTVSDIPAFGERFYFYEKIQGGQHFFAYADKMAEQYTMFVQQTEHRQLMKQLTGESHWKFAELIDALLFGYFLKFGQSYLAEALFVIETAVSRFRHSKPRVLSNKIMEFVADSKIIMMIDQATSPSFFLAELLEPIFNDGIEFGSENIQKRYADRTKAIYKSLLAESRFSDEPIITTIRTYHGL